jgi:hypothetical protein
MLFLSSATARRRIRVAASTLALCAALGLLLWQLHGHYPLQKWMFWRYVQYWLFALAFSLMCVSGGYRVLDLMGPRRLPLRERLLFAMALGVLLFFLGMFLGGIFGWYGVPFAIAWPVLLFASGVRPLFRYSRRAWRHLSARRRRAFRPGGWQVLAALLGLLGFLIVYAGICTPEAASWDTRWYHLALPERFAAAGGIERSPEGWFHTALPHLASLIYTWPYLFPWTKTFDQVELAAHLEFVLFVWTVFSIGPLVRHLVPGVRASGAWAAFFLFSGVFVYDSSLNFGADHIAAFWAVPIWLALRRALLRRDVASSALLGAMLAGAMNTKVQCIALVVPVGLVVAMFGVYALFRRRKVLAAPFVTLGSLALLTTPFWLRNLVWYGDPFYPALHRHLKLRPWHEDMAFFYETLVKPNFWRPSGTTLEQAKQTAEATFTFAFKPHDWYWMHGEWPVFGFLFSLSWLVLPFIGTTRRLWGLFVSAHVGVVTWFLFSHQDRYLQMLVPWMAGCVAALVVIVWRLSSVARVPLVALLGIQAVWGFAAAFIQAPKRPGTTFPFIRVMELATSGYRGDFAKRAKIFSEFQDAGSSTAPGSRILLHRMLLHAGLRRVGVMDHPNWQGLISYRRLDSQRAVYDLYRELGITHVMWASNGDSYGDETLAADLRFLGFVTHTLHGESRFGGYALAPLPSEPPSVQPRDSVLFLGCRDYSPGLYEISDLVVLPGAAAGTAPAPRTRLEPNRPELVEILAAQANYIVLDKCRSDLSAPDTETGAFVFRGRRGDERLYVRQRPLFRTTP